MEVPPTLTTSSLDSAIAAGSHGSLFDTGIAFSLLALLKRLSIMKYASETASNIMMARLSF